MQLVILTISTIIKKNKKKTIIKISSTKKYNTIPTTKIIANILNL